ncbi:MAG: hypothetical protein M3Y86_03855 [Verrucomicrobiota bacterium]|nr:hypothetical protein [Verrucomicrobiota bacterium]
MARIFLALLLTASSALAQNQSTAYDAMKLVGRQVSKVALSRIVSVTGVDGDPQPTKWNILVVDRHAPAGVREITVANGRIIANGPPARAVVGSTREATLATSQLNLDSSGAFSVASYTADKSHVNFSFVSYTLRTNDRGLPVWIVTLQDDARRPLGTISINANKGNVTRVEGLYRGANMAHVEEDRGGGRVVQRGPVERTQPNDEYADAGHSEEVEPGDADENVIKHRIKMMFRRTTEDAQRMFHRVRRSFADFIAGDDRG